MALDMSYSHNRHPRFVVKERKYSRGWRKEHTFMVRDLDEHEAVMLGTQAECEAEALRLNEERHRRLTHGRY